MSTEAYRQPFTRLKDGFSQVRRLPRLGKIRLGIKVQKLKEGGRTVEYPRETSHFVVPPEVAEVYGDTPTELDVMLPVEDPEIVFVQKLAWYGSTAGLKCHGNAETALRLDDKRKWVERSCPCEYRKTTENPKGECTEQSSLMVLLPKVSMGGCYQITTGSFHSTVTINSSLDYIKALAGRVALIPLKLRREERETHHDGKKQIHYTLNLILDADLATIRDLRENANSILIPAQYQIEGPVDDNPVLDPVDVVEGEEPEAKNKAALEDLQGKLQQTHEGGDGRVEEGHAADQQIAFDDLKKELRQTTTTADVTMLYNSAASSGEFTRPQLDDLDRITKERMQALQPAGKKR